MAAATLRGPGIFLRYKQSKNGISSAVKVTCAEHNVKLRSSVRKNIRRFSLLTLLKNKAKQDFNNTKRVKNVGNFNLALYYSIRRRQGLERGVKRDPSLV